MQMKSINQRKITSSTIHFLLFSILIRFCSSTLNITNFNLNEYIILEKFNSGDLDVIANKNNFLFISSMIKDEKNKIIEKKNFKDFDKTITYKFINEIKYKFLTINYEIIPMKETNEILNIFIENISEISEYNSHNDFFNETIINLTGIYSNYKNNYLNFVYFNEK